MGQGGAVTLGNGAGITSRRASANNVLVTVSKENSSSLMVTMYTAEVTALCNYNYKESIYFTAPGSSFFINIILRNRSLAPCYSDDATQIFIEKRTK